MFNISKFKTEIDKNGILRNNRYVAIINPPKSMAGKKSQAEQVSLRCSNIQVPGMSFATVDGPPRIGYGPIESNPYGVIFDDIVLTFIIDSKADVHKFFYEWSNSIVNYMSKGQSALKDSLGPVGNMRPYEVAYKDNYSTDIDVIIYDETGNDKLEQKKIAEIKMYKAFPRNLNSFDMAWENMNDYVRLPVTFAYTDFTVKYYT